MYFLFSYVELVALATEFPPPTSGLAHTALIGPINFPI